MAASVVWMEKGAWIAGCPCGWRSERFAARFSARRAWREHRHLADAVVTAVPDDRLSPSNAGAGDRRVSTTLSSTAPARPDIPD